MNTMEFCEALGGIGDEYVREAHMEALPRRKKRVTVLLVAACICLLIGTAAAVSGLGTRLLGFITGAETGYDLEVLAEKLPVSALGDELVREAGDAIARQYRDYELHDSWAPGHWQKRFAARGEALDCVGLAALRPLAWAPQEVRTTLNVYGRQDGTLEGLLLETEYVQGDIRLQAFSRVYTEHWTGNMSTGVRSTEDLRFTESFYTAGSGRQCHVLESSDLMSGRRCLDGYLVADGILYSLHVSFPEEDAAAARALLHIWAEEI